MLDDDKIFRKFSWEKFWQKIKAMLCNHLHELISYFSLLFLVFYNLLALERPHEAGQKVTPSISFGRKKEM